MQNYIDILDKNDTDAVRYPTIKSEGTDNEQERSVVMTNCDVKIPGLSETVFFPLDFCMEDLVIDAVAKKYSAGVENYPENHDAEHFLIGTKACRKERKKLNCTYMKKANVRMDAARINFDKIIAVYLLSLDDSNENRQNFFVMTKDKMYLFRDTYEVDGFNYNEFVFSPDGIELKQLGESVSQNLVEYTFDERFLNFAREFMLLKRTTLVNVRERHPFANVFNDKSNPDMVAEMAISVDEIDGRPLIGKRNAYMKFLVDTAAAEGHLEARTMLRLCYMAREFRIPADLMLSWLKHAVSGGIPKNKLQTEFSNTLKLIGEKYKFVFVQDLLEAGTSADGVFHRQELLNIFGRSKFGLEKFVPHYLNFIGKRNAAEFELQRAFQNVRNKENCYKPSVRAQNYDNRLSLQLVTMGAMLNEYPENLH